MPMDVKTLCLGVLHFGDATGYEIKKMVEDGMFNHFIEAKFADFNEGRGFCVVRVAHVIHCRHSSKRDLSVGQRRGPKM